MSQYQGDELLLKQLAETKAELLLALSEVIIGQKSVLEELLITVFSGGHAILLGVPGLAKTLIVKTLSELLGLPFSRIQFTPDLMPSDITGTDVLQENRETHRRELVFVHGPLFANFILADEINRTPPKTQSALLEAMQEEQITVGGNHYLLPKPFFVLATQNPIEHEGTYPLPEAQLDRFMMCIHVGYPKSENEEIEIVLRTTAEKKQPLLPMLSEKSVLEFQQLIRRIPVPHHVAQFAVRLVRASRPQDESATDFSQRNLQWGAGPRAAQFLVLGAKAHAALKGEPTVSLSDIRRVAVPVLRHRLLTNYSAQAEGIDADSLVEMLLRHAETTN